MPVNPLSLPSYNSTPSMFNNIPTPSSLGFIPGVNRTLPFGYNPMLNPMLASAQALGAGLAQMLALLPSLFGGNKNGSAATAGSSASGGSKATEQWQAKGGCEGGCDKSKGGQTQDVQRPQDSGPSQDRPEPSRTREENSSGQTRTPENSGASGGHEGCSHG